MVKFIKRGKIIAVCLVLTMMVAGLTGCSSEKQDAIVKYANEQSKAVTDLLVTATNEFNSVASDNYTSDEDVLEKLDNTVLTACNDALTKAQEIKVDDTDITALNDKLIDTVSTYKTTFENMSAAVHAGDTEATAECNTGISDSEGKLKDFIDSLNKLCEENDIEDKEE